MTTPKKVKVRVNKKMESKLSGKLKSLPMKDLKSSEPKMMSNAPKNMKEYLIEKHTTVKEVKPKK